MTKRRLEYRKELLLKSQKSPNSYARKKQIYASMTDDFPRY